MSDRLISDREILYLVTRKIYGSYPFDVLLAWQMTVGQYSQKEIAQTLDISISTVGRLISPLREELKKEFRDIYSRKT